MAFAQPHASSLWLGLGRKSKVMASSLAYLCFWATWLFIEGAHAVVQGSSGSQGEASFPACSCAVQEGEPGGPLGQGQKEEVQGWIWYRRKDGHVLTLVDVAVLWVTSQVNRAHTRAGRRVSCASPRSISLGQCQQVSRGVTPASSALGGLQMGLLLPQMDMELQQVFPVDARFSGVWKTTCPGSGLGEPAGSSEGLVILRYGHCVISLPSDSWLVLSGQHDLTLVAPWKLDLG